MTKHCLLSSCILVLACILLMARLAPAAPQPPEQLVRPTQDTTSVLHNPAMGWVLYLDAVGKYPDAKNLWRDLSPYAKYATIFYHRARWSDYEPTEGHYAWLEDPNFQQMLQGARQRGLKLAFRIIVNSRDNYAQATPDYVRQAGAKGYFEQGANHTQLWCPNLDDPIFQAKFARFIQAFGRAFDKPNVVDFVDGNGLGWWGEAHHLQLNEAKLDGVYNWVCATYSSAFPHVLLATNIGSEFGLKRDEAIAIKQYSYIARRDGLGSHWFGPEQKQFTLGHFPQVPLIGESCYFSVKNWTDPWKGEAGVQDYRDILAWDVRDALDYHANTLDLRNPNDAKTWVEDAPELVQKFISEGGYRLSPVEIRFPSVAVSGQPFKIHHTWQNTGVGVLPNANPRWHYKYQVAFALFDSKTKKPVAIQLAPGAEPSGWIKGLAPQYDSALRWSVPAGTYSLGVAIVDTTQQNAPGIELAVQDLKRVGGWYLLSSAQMKK